MVKFFRYYGSKTYLLNDIYVAMNPIRAKINCFVDVFGGCGVVVLNLPRHWRIPNKVYNDLDNWLYTTFKVIQNPSLKEKLLEKLEFAFAHRKVFTEYKEDYFNKKSLNLNDIEIAFRIIYLCQNSFDGDLKTFGLRITEKRNDLNQSINSIKNFVSIIQSIQFENLDYRKIIKKYDSPNTFFYLDPPYITRGEKYRFGDWGVEAFAELKLLLDGIQGLWLMNEGEKDFGEITKIFGEPKFTKSYINYIHNRQQLENFERKCSLRLEGFWANYDVRKPLIAKPLAFFSP